MQSITVTTQKAINYGAVLQAYALQTIQRNMGIDNKILNLPRLSPFFATVPIKMSRQALIALALNASTLLHYKEKMTIRRKFDSFLQNKLEQTSLFSSVNELRGNPPEADFYINGSDQVFSLRGEQDAERMLDFGPKETPRYSYAGSLGEYDWTEEEKSQFKALINGFRLISVREEYAKEYLSSFIEREMLVHMDPTFIVDTKKWKQMAVKPQVNEKYVLVFPLVGNRNMKKAIEKIKAQTGYKIICLQNNSIRRYKADKYICDAGPEEFLGWILNSEIVLSSSFHGTAFSIMFHKPFYTFTKDYKAQRITGLLDMLDLNDRLYAPNSQMKFEIDFDKADTVIAIEKNRCFDYFRRIIEDCHHD